jgi:hypothetical protein
MQTEMVTFSAKNVTIIHSIKNVTASVNKYIYTKKAVHCMN